MLLKPFSHAISLTSKYHLSWPVKPTHLLKKDEKTNKKSNLVSSSLTWYTLSIMLIIMYRRGYILQIVNPFASTWVFCSRKEVDLERHSNRVKGINIVLYLWVNTGVWDITGEMNSEFKQNAISNHLAFISIHIWGIKKHKPNWRETFSN